MFLDHALLIKPLLWDKSRYAEGIGKAIAYASSLADETPAANR